MKSICKQVARAHCLIWNPNPRVLACYPQGQASNFYKYSRISFTGLMPTLVLARIKTENGRKYDTDSEEHTGYSTECRVNAE